LNISKAEVIKGWPLGIMEGFFAENGVYNAEPLKDTLTGYLGNGP